MNNRSIELAFDEKKAEKTTNTNRNITRIIDLIDSLFNIHSILVRKTENQRQHRNCKLCKRYSDLYVLKKD